MDRKLIVKQFATEPGLAFIEVIRTASTPVGAREIKALIADAGVGPVEVDRWWKRSQPYLRLHPHIEKTPNNRYEWRIEAEESAASLGNLAEITLKRIPSWLTHAYVDNVSDSLAIAESSGPRSQGSWARQRELGKAILLASIAAEVGARQADGASAVDVVDFIMKHADRAYISRFNQPGDTTKFDSDRHESIDSSRLKAGELVTVARPGFVWNGAGDDTVVVKARVVAQSRP
ncbi:hypothetical protein [Cryptosporangium sp. NPDC048952]|uniref:hypothetical protein n=1 Tax=Cryptosporangium sp. NPDC048952 TaxID=3363961 RepID=UPI00371148F1